MAFSSRRGRIAVLATLLVVVALAAWLRFQNLSWGTELDLPGCEPSYFNWHADEVKLIQPAANVLSSGNIFELGRFMYPPLHAYLTAAVSWAMSVRSIVDIHLIARGRGALASVASVLVCFFAAARHGRLAGIVAAALLCVSVGPAVNARWANPDELCAFFSVLALALGLAAMTRRSWMNFVLLGVALGFAMGSKQIAVMLLPLPVAAYLLRRSAGRTPLPGASWDRFWRLGTVAAVTASAALLLCGALVAGLYRHQLGLLANSGEEGLALVVVLGAYFGAGVCVCVLCASVGLSGRGRVRRKVFAFRKPLLSLAAAVCVGACFYVPQSVAEPRPFLANTRYMMQTAHASYYYGKPQADPGYLADAIPRGMGLCAYALSVAGLAVCLCRRDLRRTGIFLLVYLLPLLLVLESTTLTFVRYGAVLYPALCVAAGVGSAALLEARWASVATKGFVGAAITLALFCGFVRTHAAVRAYEAADEPRMQAAMWLSKNHRNPLVGVRDRPGTLVYPWAYEPAGVLDGVRGTCFEDAPPYVLVTSFNESMLRRIGSPRDRGYVTAPAVWWPASPPSE